MASTASQGSSARRHVHPWTACGSQPSGSARLHVIANAANDLTESEDVLSRMESQGVRITVSGCPAVVPPGSLLLLVQEHKECKKKGWLVVPIEVRGGAKPQGAARA